MVITPLRARISFLLTISRTHYQKQQIRNMTSAAAKHVLNDPATLVVDSLKGLATLNPEIKLDEASRGEPIFPFSPSCWDLVAGRGTELMPRSSRLQTKQEPSGPPLWRWFRS